MQPQANYDHRFCFLVYLCAAIAIARKAMEDSLHLIVRKPKPKPKVSKCQIVEAGKEHSQPSESNSQDRSLSRSVSIREWKNDRLPGEILWCFLRDSKFLDNYLNAPLDFGRLKGKVKPCVFCCCHHQVFVCGC